MVITSYSTSIRRAIRSSLTIPPSTISTDPEASKGRPHHLARPPTAEIPTINYEIGNYFSRADERHLAVALIDSYERDPSVTVALMGMLVFKVSVLFY